MCFNLFQEPKNSSADSDNVRVVVRCRPMNSKEKEANCQQAVTVCFGPTYEMHVIRLNFLFHCPQFSQLAVLPNILKRLPRIHSYHPLDNTIIFKHTGNAQFIVFLSFISYIGREKAHLVHITANSII